jgi:plasmid maintenance system antidote protein VapI
MSLEDVASLIDPKPSKMTISRLERGQRKMTMEWASKIAGALGVSVADLFGEQDASFVTPSWLDTEMKRLGLKRADLARLLDIPASGVTDMLNGERNISVEEARAISEWVNETRSQRTGQPIAPAPAIAATVPVYRMVEEAGFFKRSDEVGKVVPLDGFNGFAISYSGFDASPRYEEGDLLFIDTDRPTRRGDYVYVARASGFVSVRRFEGRTSAGFQFVVIDSGEAETVPADDVIAVNLVRGSAIA